MIHRNPSLAIHRPAQPGTFALSNALLLAQAPSVFAPAAHRGVSERYAFVPTSQVVDSLRAEGWAPVAVREQKVHLESRSGVQKHLLRFARVDDLLRRIEDGRPELVLTNSHDRSCAYRLCAGVYRQVCSNGLIVAETSFASIRIPHIDFEPSRLIEASLNVAREMPRLSALIDAYKARQLSGKEQNDFAEAAMLARYEDLALAPVWPATLLRRRRSADAAPTLWNTLNVVQENMVRGCAGDQRMHPKTFRALGNVRQITGLDEDVRINKTLWQMADTVFAGGDVFAVLPRRKPVTVEAAPQDAAALLN